MSSKLHHTCHVRKEVAEKERISKLLKNAQFKKCFLDATLLLLMYIAIATKQFLQFVRRQSNNAKIRHTEEIIIICIRQTIALGKSSDKNYLTGFELLSSPHLTLKKY